MHTIFMNIEKKAIFKIEFKIISRKVKKNIYMGII